VGLVSLKYSNEANEVVVAAGKILKDVADKAALALDERMK
jgi:hypothetical protein